MEIVFHAIPDVRLIQDGCGKEYRLTRYPEYFEVTNRKGTKIWEIVYNDDPVDAARYQELLALFQA